MFEDGEAAVAGGDDGDVERAAAEVEDHPALAFAGGGGAVGDGGGDGFLKQRRFEKAGELRGAAGGVALQAPNAAGTVMTAAVTSSPVARWTSARRRFEHLGGKFLGGHLLVGGGEVQLVGEAHPAFELGLRVLRDRPARHRRRVCPRPCGRSCRCRPPTA